MSKLSENMLSVGIDIGTSTTQLVLSMLTIENMASNFTVPRIVIVDKRVIYKSAIIFTPILEDNRIDMEKIESFVEQQYAAAGIQKEEIQTGAVIITGETARRENANEVLRALSGFAGDFVVATAGPDLESIIAAKGAGVHNYSQEHSTSVINIDIGGGTSNLAFVHNGEVVDTGCLDLGGRLVKVERQTKEITYISPKIQELIDIKKLSIRLGDTATEDKLAPLIEEMVQLVKESVGMEVHSPFYERCITHKGLKRNQNAKCISFTGGVADSIYNDYEGDPFLYGDIGIMFGAAIRQSSILKNFTLVRPDETIRATVVGAGSHTTEISGSTITYTGDFFPIKNIPVLKLTSDDERLAPEEFGERMREKLEWFKVDGRLEHVAIALRGKQSPTFKEIEKLGTGLALGMAELMSKESPIIIITEEDIGKVLGQTLFSQTGNEEKVICLDGIKVENGDYIDIGKPIANGKVLPVVIKTLVFH